MPQVRQRMTAVQSANPGNSFATDEFAQIQTFIKVVEDGSFSAAARCTNSSVSSIARQIQALQVELGIRLLNRTTRSLALTEPGQVFHDRVSTIARELSNAKSEAASFRGPDHFLTCCSDTRTWALIFH
ncbi:LysR family transcriptional regulator [Paraburkholderia podalyriae]|uniref:LysR family transcriptional regulator n=2 Tax=Paraburkholderia TaxID=1822464 RepID=A0ABR7PI21_9BURK|nr:LysR family transcriptional regulator [Paraburkholderia podalyriae]